MAAASPTARGLLASARVAAAQPNAGWRRRAGCCAWKMYLALSSCFWGHEPFLSVPGGGQRISSASGGAWCVRVLTQASPWAAVRGLKVCWSTAEGSLHF